MTEPHLQQFKVYQDSKHRFRWTLYVDDEPIAECRKDGYDTHEECMESIRLLADLASRTGVSDTVEGRWHRRP